MAGIKWFINAIKLTEGSPYNVDSCKVLSEASSKEATGTCLGEEWTANWLYQWVSSQER